MPLWRWSQTASANGTADPTAPFPAGMAASSVSPGIRGAMAAVAQYRDDIAGAIVTAGTSTAYTVSSYSSYTSLPVLNGQMIAFSPHATNGATVTLSVDSLGAKPLRTSPGVELQAGTIIQGTPYVAVYNNVDGAFYLQGFYGNPYSVPVLGGMDFWDTITPNSSFIFPMGQAISRTTYAATFARWGTKFGPGDGSTTFNVPDKTGRVSAMMEAAASRLTSTYFGGNSTQIGAVGGAEKETLLTANLPAYTPAGSIAVTNGAITLTNNVVLSAGGGNLCPGGGSVGFATTVGVSQAASSASFTGTAQGGSSTPVVTVPPLIVCNYIIRII